MLTRKAFFSLPLNYIRNACYRRNFSRPCSSSPPCKRPDPKSSSPYQVPANKSIVDYSYWKKMEQMYTLQEIDFIRATYDPDRVLPKGYMWVHSFDPYGEPDGLGLMSCLECGQFGDHIDKDCPNKDTEEAKAFQRKNFPELFKE